MEEPEIKLADIDHVLDEIFSVEDDEDFKTKLFSFLTERFQLKDI